MPTKVYTNKDLKKPVPKDEVRDVAYWNPADPAWKGYSPSTVYGPEEPVENRLAAAKAALARPSVVRAPSVYDLEAVDQQIKASVPEPTLRERLQGLTEAGKVGGSLGLEAIEESPLASPSVRVAASLGKWFVPTYYPALAASGARKILAPVDQSVFDLPEDESRLGGVGEVALSAAGPLVRAAGRGAQALKGLREQAATRGAYTTAREAFETGATRGGRVSARPTKLGLGREKPYRMEAPTVDPNQVLAVAREVAAETGQPIEQVLKGYAKSGGVSKEQMAALRGLAASGRSVPQEMGAARELVNPSIDPAVMESMFQEARPTFLRMQRAGAFSPEGRTILSEARMNELLARFGGQGR